MSVQIVAPVASRSRCWCCRREKVGARAAAAVADEETLRAVAVAACPNTPARSPPDARRSMAEIMAGVLWLIERGSKGTW